MQCSSCGGQLPTQVTYCPACGVLVSYNVSPSGVSSHDSTTVASPGVSSHDSTTEASPDASSHEIPPPPPPTYYGSSSYGDRGLNPYKPIDPYASSLQAPPQAQPRPHRTSPWLFRIPLTILVTALIIFITIDVINNNLPGVDHNHLFVNSVFMTHYPPVISVISIILFDISIFSIFLCPIWLVISGIIHVISTIVRHAAKKVKTLL